MTLATIAIWLSCYVFVVWFFDRHGGGMQKFIDGTAGFLQGKAYTIMAHIILFIFSPLLFSVCLWDIGSNLWNRIKDR